MKPRPIIMLSRSLRQRLVDGCALFYLGAAVLISLAYGLGLFEYF